MTFPNARACSLLTAALALAALLAFAPQARAAAEWGPSIIGCAACQAIVADANETTGEEDEKAIVVDMSKPCSILEAADRKGCENFARQYGPKFIKAVQRERLRGKSPAQICSMMGYCQ